MNDPSIERYSVFISGETIDLCVPSKLAIDRDGWADWFNDPEITSDLDQGMFPVTREDQIEFYESLRRKRDRLTLLICTKGNGDAKQRAIGVISLSRINLQRRSAEIAVVLPKRAERMANRDLPPLRGLEAMALLTEHAFAVLGLERVGAGQVFPSQRGFNQKLTLLGYRTEGVFRRAFTKGRTFADIVKIACLYDTYQAIKKARNGQLWPGNEAMHKLIKALPKKSYADLVDQVLRRAEADYFASLRVS